jgi:hypothetical protein
MDLLIPPPVSRKLRIFTFDPSLTVQFDLAGIGEITISVPWEEALTRGPVGEYLEVVDVDPASGAAYVPVDLNQQAVLAQDGVAPSETNPLFHQQMVYAVAMTTIGHFERALGRVALWASHRDQDGEEQFVRRLRIYPHALRDRNAYYSPAKKALLFGYFPVGVKDAHNTPGTLVFTCLSHDIIAHETTHALLDGVHPRFAEPHNRDVLAFHEAFADLVALFQHFAYPGVLRDQINRTRGDLAAENLLGQLAQQFGRASGRGAALRDALGGVDPATGHWRAHQPDVFALNLKTQPHERGAVLVAAVFGAFLKVYRSRTADLYRIATEGTGVLRAGDLPPDLSNRLADEAAKSAQSVLQMCIRAIDYCPPVGITFGDYLRGLITADFELYPDPESNEYRLAFIESFRQWGIHPEGMRSMSVESLLWPQPAWSDRLRSLFEDEQDTTITDEADAPREPQRARRHLRPWNLDSDRYRTWRDEEVNAAILWNWLMKGRGRDIRDDIGLVTDSANTPPTVFRSRSGDPAVEVHSVRTSLRRGPRGSMLSDLVVEITQRRRGYFDPDKQKRLDAGPPLYPSERGDFLYRAGCTLLVDPRTMTVRRVIRTPGTIADSAQLERVRRFLDGGLEPANAFDRARDTIDTREPFALLHREAE